MRGEHLLFGAAIVVAVLAGCGAARHAGADVGTHAIADRGSTARAPQDADVPAVMERFYQLIEGEHWRFADAMLTPRFRAALGAAGIRARYENLAGIDVTLQQTGPSAVVAQLGATMRNGRARHVRYVETVRLSSTGGEWAIDAIARRDVSPGTLPATSR